MFDVPCFLPGTVFANFFGNIFGVFFLALLVFRFVHNVQ